jgi:hypothetical protein
MSGRIALGLLQHFAEHEAEILDRLRRHFFADYMRLIGRMLPRRTSRRCRPRKWRMTRAVRRALNRVETGQGTLTDVEAALAGVGTQDGLP